MNPYQAYLAMAKQADGEKVDDHSLVMPMAAGGAAIGTVGSGIREGLSHRHESEAIRARGQRDYGQAEALHNYNVRTHADMTANRARLKEIGLDGFQDAIGGAGGQMPDLGRSLGQLHHAGEEIAGRVKGHTEAAGWNSIKRVGKLGLLGGATAGAALGFALKNPEIINRRPDEHYHMHIF